MVGKERQGVCRGVKFAIMLIEAIAAGVRARVHVFVGGLSWNGRQQGSLLEMGGMGVGGVGWGWGVVPSSFRE